MIAAATLQALKDFPAQLQAHYAAIPGDYVHWAPPSWEGVPSEALTALEQLCHVRDIEVEGYHVRLRRTLAEENPLLVSLDSEVLARDRGYGNSDAAAVLDDFARARTVTVEMIANMD